MSNTRELPEFGLHQLYMHIALQYDVVHVLAQI